MKYFYIAVTIQENGKYYSYVVKANNQENLLSKLKIKNIVTATIAATEQQAYSFVTVGILSLKKTMNIYSMKHFNKKVPEPFRGFVFSAVIIRLYFFCPKNALKTAFIFYSITSPINIYGLK